MYFMEIMGVWIMNMTPHSLVIELPDGQRVEIPVSGEPVRLAENREKVGPMIERVSYKVERLPAPTCGPDGRPVLYVVSNPVAQAAAGLGRTDFVAPDTSRGAIRDSDGKIVAVRGFIMF